MPNLTLNPETTESDDDRVAPSFKIFSGALKAYEKGDGTSRKYLRCTASSTVKDLHGDFMTAECVQGMAPQAKSKGMTIFLNHSYKVPEDVFGKTADAVIVQRSNDENGNAIYDLDLEIELNESNERAIKTYESIKDQGMKLGVSIGAMIEDWAFIDEEAGWWGGLEIKAVNLLEASIVGIPANQRSWVINGMNALGAPREVIAKALGKTPPEEAVKKNADPEPEPPVEPEEAHVHQINHTYMLNGLDVTNEITITTTDTIIKSDDSAAPDEETTDEEDTTSGEEEDTPDPTDTDKGLAPVDAAKTVEDLKVAGISDPLLDIVMGFLEGATEEVVSLREQLATVTKERDEAIEQVRGAAEIVETIARTPLGRKAQFTGPVTSFRQKYGGLYDESIVKMLEGDPDDE